MAMTWTEVLAATGAALHSGKLRENDTIPHITTDTRRIATGDLFVALRGEHFDGADFAADALRRARQLFWSARQSPSRWSRR